MPAATKVTQFGRYQIHRKLGEGGMGTVYLAHDTALKRWVALKIPHFGPHQKERVIARFQREAETAASIDHPNVCSILDIGQNKGVHYLTMTYIEGQPLSREIERDQPWPPGEAAWLILKLAGALGALHERGLIHRDLKPGNVLLRQGRNQESSQGENLGARKSALAGEPVLVDFGLARSYQDTKQRLTRVGQLVGTPAYMSPEQAMGAEDQGPATDIYALGVIFYELLTGQVPFAGGSPDKVLAWILHANPKPPSELCEALGPQEDELVLKALAKDPDHRYASMEEFANAIQAYLNTSWTLPEEPDTLPPNARKTAQGVSPAAPTRLPRAEQTLAAQDAPATGTEGRGTHDRTKEPNSPPTHQPWVLIGALAVVGVLLLLTGLAGAGLWWALSQGNKQPKEPFVQVPPKKQVKTPQVVPRLTLLVVPEVSVAVGSSRTFLIRITRENCPGAVDLSLEGLPQGVEVKPLWIPAGETESLVTLSVASGVSPGIRSARLVAQAGDVQTDAKLGVEVLAPPQKSTLTLLPIATTQLRGGTTQSVKVQIRRENCPGPVELRLEDLPSGVESAPAFLRSSTSEGRLTLKAGTKVQTGLRVVRIRAVAATANAQGAFTLALTAAPTPTKPRMEPTEGGGVVVVTSPYTSMTGYRGQNGKRFRFQVTGSKKGSVYGTGTYTDDSSLASVVVHAGLFAPGETGIVEATILPGQGRYTGSTSHGITSSSWGSYSGSYQVRLVKMVSKLPTVNGVTILNDPGTLGSYRKYKGKSFYFRVTGNANGTLYGTGIYTDDSYLATAAVHAGLLRPGETGILMVTILGGQSRYLGSRRYGITSRSYGSWSGSYSMKLMKKLARVPGVLPDPGTLTKYRGQNGRSYLFRVTGKTTGTVYGTFTYTDDSSLATAVVHAGLLKPGQTGTVKVTILPGQSRYTSSTRNGVKTYSYSSWYGSFRVSGP